MFVQTINLNFILDLLGVFVFAASGALTAGRKGMDLFGVVVIAIVTAIGGGTLRDLLLDRHPIFWIMEPGYLVFITISSLITIIYVKRFKPPFKLLLFLDALGLAFFTITGTRIADSMNYHFIVSIIMGMITGVAGGVVRDILSNEIPLILRRDIYATATLFGASAYLVLHRFLFNDTISAWVSICIIMGFRWLAIQYHLKLPVFHLKGESESANDQ